MKISNFTALNNVNKKKSNQIYFSNSKNDSVSISKPKEKSKVLNFLDSPNGTLFSRSIAVISIALCIFSGIKINKYNRILEHIKEVSS